MSEWKRHDGGPCPVDPDDLVELPAGTYHGHNNRGTLGPFRAGDLKWRNEEHFHLRDEIQSYRVVSPKHKEIK